MIKFLNKKAKLFNSLMEQIITMGRNTEGN